MLGDKLCVPSITMMLSQVDKQWLLMSTVLLVLRTTSTLNFDVFGFHHICIHITSCLGKGTHSQVIYVSYTPHSCGLKVISYSIFKKFVHEAEFYGMEFSPCIIKC